MKKTFNRLLAATVAIPVGLSQILAISASAANPVTAEITANDMVYVNPETNFPENATGDTITFTQESTWNTVLNDKIGNTAGKTMTLDAKSIVGAITSTNYYATLLKELVAASANPTATMENGVITITGDANLVTYIAPELDDKLTDLGYADSMDTSALENITYVATITTDLANSKSMEADLTITAGGKDYTIDTIADYMDVVYNDFVAQIEAAVDQKIADLAAETGLTEEEIRANADYNIDSDLAAFKETTDKFAADIDAFNTKYAFFKTATTAEKTYATADEALAASLDYIAKNGIQSAANQPANVDGMIAKYGTAFDNTISSLNSSLADAGVNVKLAVSASNIATMLKNASDFTVSATNGTFSADFAITDVEYDTVVAYVEAKVAELYTDKEIESVTTEKMVGADISATGAVSFDVLRNVVVVLKDKETTTTSETTTGSDETGTQTTASTDGTGTQTTASTDGTGTQTTASTDGTGTQTTASTDGTGDGSDTTATTVSTETSTETVPPSTDVQAIDVELLDADASNGVYFSHEESFNAVDLIKSVTLTLVDGTTQTVDPATAIGFVSTPGEVYDSAEVTNGAKYFKGEIEVYYMGDADKTPLAVKPTVAVAMKGDTNLDGKLSERDAFLTLMYWSKDAAGTAAAFTDGTDPLVEKLAYYVSDIDTESKAGANSDAGKITDTDAFFILLYWSKQSAGQEDVTWEKVIARQ